MTDLDTLVDLVMVPCVRDAQRRSGETDVGVALHPSDFRVFTAQFSHPSGILATHAQLLTRHGSHEVLARRWVKEGSATPLLRRSAL